MLSLSATHTGWLPECHDMSRAQRTLLGVSPKGWSPGNPGVVFGDLGVYVTMFLQIPGDQQD